MNWLPSTRPYPVIHPRPGLREAATSFNMSNIFTLGGLTGASIVLGAIIGASVASRPRRPRRSHPHHRAQRPSRRDESL